MTFKSNTGGGPMLNAPGNLRQWGSSATKGGGVHLDAEREAAAAEVLPQKVVILVPRTDGRVLTVTRFGDASDVNLPGGSAEDWEEPVEAARRELEEETGLVAGRMVKIRSERIGDKVVSTFKVLSYTGRLRSSPEGDVGWSDPEDVAKSTFGEYFKKLLPYVV